MPGCPSDWQLLPRDLHVAQFKSQLWFWTASPRFPIAQPFQITDASWIAKCALQSSSKTFLIILHVDLNVSWSSSFNRCVDCWIPWALPLQIAIPSSSKSQLLLRDLRVAHSNPNSLKSLPTDSSELQYQFLNIYYALSFKISTIPKEVFRKGNNPTCHHLMHPRIQFTYALISKPLILTSKPMNALVTSPPLSFHSIYRNSFHLILHTR